MDTSSCQEEICCVCSEIGIELKVIPCNCRYHVFCFPKSHLVSNSNIDQNNASLLVCPTCKRSDMKGVYIVPLDTQVLRTQDEPSDFDQGCANSSLEIEVKMSFEMEEFYLSLAPMFCSADDESIATSIEISQDVEISRGKWTVPEINFINGLISAFKDGDLILQNGVTLDDFLRSIFLCKSTRLRKKIKNANFCTSTYKLKEQGVDHSISKGLMKLKTEFLDSLDDEEKKSLLKFGMSRMLKTHFFNLCLQLGYDYILQQDWLESLQRIDKKITAARRSKEQRHLRYQTSIQLCNNTAHTEYIIEKDNNPAGFVHYVDYSTSTINHNFKDGSHYSSNPSEQKSVPFTTDHWVLSSIVSREQIDAPRELSNINYINHSSTPTFELKHANYDPRSREKQNSPTRPMFNTCNPHQNEMNEVFIRDSLGSVIDRGICHPPQLVPVEIKDVLDCAASLSDISDSESVDKLSLGGVKDMRPLKKKFKVDNFDGYGCGVASNFNVPFEPMEHGSSSILGLSEVCEKVGDWSPFMKKVSDFIEVEQLPFDYFDVWLMSTYDTIEQGSSCTDKTSNICLRYVGHSPKNNGSIWTLYHMNEFGKHSSNYKFNPGVGLPGRVFASGRPQWDDCIPELSSDMFPRVEAARRHGIKKALGIPIFHTPLGKVVVAMYTCEDTMQYGIQQHLVQKCCNFFQISNVLSSKWQLVLDVGGDVSDKLMESDFKCIDQQEEETIAKLLTNYFSSKVTDALGYGENDNRLLMDRTSYLQHILLQPSHERTQAENDSISLVKKYYRSLSEENHKENDLAPLLLHEWATKGLAPKKNSQIDSTSTLFLTHVDYS